MQKIELTLIMLLLIFFSGCTIPEIDDKPQCSPDFVLIEEDGRRYIDEEKTTCRCRMYRRTPEYLGSIGNFWDEDITHCHKMIGETLDVYPDVAAFYEEIRQAYQNAGISKKKKKKK